MLAHEYEIHRTSIPDIAILSPRELEVMRLATRGVMNKGIARQLGLSVRTVESHRANIMSKLKLNNFAELVRVAVEQKLI